MAQSSAPVALQIEVAGRDDAGWIVTRLNDGGARLLIGADNHVQFRTDMKLTSVLELIEALEWAISS